MGPTLTLNISPRSWGQGTRIFFFRRKQTLSLIKERLHHITRNAWAIFANLSARYSRFIMVWKVDVFCFLRHISNIFNQVGNLFWHIYLVYSGYDYDLRIILHNDILQIYLTCFLDCLPNRQSFCNKNLLISNRFAWHLNNLSFTVPASATNRRGPLIKSILDAFLQIL